jgi:hypothetical protein
METEKLYGATKPYLRSSATPRLSLAMARGGEALI